MGHAFWNRLMLATGCFGFDRKARNRSRTVFRSFGAFALENAFGESLDGITNTDALHYFQHSGYAKQLKLKMLELDWCRFQMFRRPVRAW